MTYPDPAVREAMAARFIGLKLDHRDSHVRELTVIWLPTLLITDHREVIHYRNVNAVPPDDLLDVLDLGEAHVRLRWAKPDVAERILAGALARRNDGPLTPELIFWHAIAAYNMGDHDDDARDRIWARLLRDYPESIWAHRVPWTP